jgi:uncharacterized membrane protein
MRIRYLNNLLIIDILSILLIVTVIFFPSSPARIILGIPFLLFFPGYSLVKALYVGEDSKDGLELIALSVGLSLAIVALIGFGLNFTSLGIRLESILSVVGGFVILISNIALIRQYLTSGKPQIMPSFSFNSQKEALLGFSFYLFWTVLAVSAIAALAVSATSARTTENFSEFYLLGPGGTAKGFPTDFILVGSAVDQVSYGTDSFVAANGWGNLKISIVNHEKQSATYSIKVLINDKPTSLLSDGAVVDQIGIIFLKADETWVQEIGIAPAELGNNQKVEFLLYKNSEALPGQSLSLRINVRGPA